MLFFFQGVKCVLFGALEADIFPVEISPLMECFYGILGSGSPLDEPANKLKENAA